MFNNDNFNPCCPTSCNGLTNTRFSTSIYGDFINTTKISVNTNNTTLPLGTTLIANGITNQNNMLNVAQNGTYLINYGINGRIFGTGTYIAGIYINDNNIPTTNIRGTNNNSISAQHIIALNQGQNISLRIVDTLGNTITLEENANLPNTYLNLVKIA